MIKKDTSDVIQKFIKGSVSCEEAQKKTGKSRATIYRYARLITKGEQLVDKRTFGNNRKYKAGK